MNDSYGVTGILGDDPFHNEPPPPPGAEDSRWAFRGPLAVITLVTGLIIFVGSLISVSFATAGALPDSGRNLKMSELDKEAANGKPVQTDEDDDTATPVVVEKPEPVPFFPATTWGVIAGLLWVGVAATLWKDLLAPTAVLFLGAIIATFFMVVPV